MKFLFFILLPGWLFAQQSREADIDFCGQDVKFSVPSAAVSDHALLSTADVISFYNTSLEGRYASVIAALRDYQKKNTPDDWLFYQLIRRTAQSIAPKEKNYALYTMYKWFFLTSSGYDAIITLSENKMLFYIQCNENIYNIPYRTKNGKQYVCLNYHDYKDIDFLKEHFTEVILPSPPSPRTFSYKVTKVPDFKATEYLERDLHFSYDENDYHFRVKISPQVQKLFTNYPVTDYGSYFNIPLSRETYNSLIPQLRKNLHGMKIKSGVDYLMRFTRYAFLFEPDTEHFGSEKRLSPEQTLFYDQSDCEDRVALFFYLVKEIYDLPMIVMEYPAHVSIAVGFDKAYGQTVDYNGTKYSICEPSPQKEDLQIGEMLPALRDSKFQIAFAYKPSQK